MTLQEWSSKHRWNPRPYVERDGTATEFCTVPLLSGDAHRELFALSDYIVSTVTGGAVWLTPRRFSQA